MLDERTSMHDQPKVLRVIQEFYPRVTGPANQAFRTSKMLEAAGWSSPIYTTSAGACGAPTAEQIDGVSVRRFPYHGQLFRAVFAPALVAAVARAPAAVVHVHQWRNPSADAALLISHTRRIPLVVQSHGAASGYKRMVRGKHALPFQIYDRLFGWVPRLASAAVAATAGERADLLAYGFPPERVHVIPVGLDVDTLPAVPPRSTLTGRLLFVGRVGPDRRVEHLIRLLAIVARAIPSASLRVVGRIDPSVGSAGKGYVTFLLDLAQGLGVAERLEFVGEITGPALWDEYTTADVYVNMSVYENFGQAFLEAAAMELPLFSTSVGVAASLIVPGETGYFLDAANLENTAMNVIRVLQHPGLWRHMGRSAAAIARRDYSLAAVARAYMNLYRDLIQHPWPAMSDPLTRPGMRQAAPPPESEALVMNQDTMRESTSSAGVHERAGV